MFNSFQRSHVVARKASIEPGTGIWAFRLLMHIYGRCRPLAATAPRTRNERTNGQASTYPVMNPTTLDTERPREIYASHRGESVFSFEELPNKEMDREPIGSSNDKRW